MCAGAIAGVCYYCGCLGDSHDHVPPISLAPEDPDFCEDLAFWLIPACRECNIALGVLPVLLIGARKAHLLRYYRSKYRKELRMPDWGKDEVEALGHNLRSKVLTGMAIKAAVIARMGVLERECLEPTLEDYRERRAGAAR